VFLFLLKKLFILNAIQIQGREGGRPRVEGSDNAVERPGADARGRREGLAHPRPLDLLEVGLLQALEKLLIVEIRAQPEAWLAERKVLRLGPARVAVAGKEDRREIQGDRRRGIDHRDGLEK
jgi:hypothetical protein